MKTWKNRAQKLLVIHNWLFWGSFFIDWFLILEIKLRHPLFFLLCDMISRGGLDSWITWSLSWSQKIWASFKSLNFQDPFYHILENLNKKFQTKITGLLSWCIKDLWCPKFSKDQEISEWIYEVISLPKIWIKK